MKYILGILLSFIALGAFAQEATILSVAADPLNIAASKYPMTDLNGRTAPLVIVEVLADNVEFKGSVLDGGVVKKTGEYWVYMGAGAKMLRIQSDRFLPVDIRFPDYGIPRLEPAATYVVRLALPQASLQSAAAGHNYLVLNVSPADAKVTLDGRLQELHEGTLRMLLRRNTTHEYLVEAPGYESEQGTVSIGAEKVVRTISLRSLKGTLAVSAATSGTDIYINGEKTATDSWRGELMPGDYLVEGRLAGHRPAEQLATVVSGEQTSVTIPALAAITGSLNVDFRPDGAAIAIDGMPHGTTPDVLDGIPVGTHRVTISAPGHATLTRDVTITDSEVAILSGSLDPVATPAATPQPVGAPTPALPTAEAPQAATSFSTTPIHLALCATAPDGRTVYITADQWQSLSTAEQARYGKIGVCISKNNESFLIELDDKEDGKAMVWEEALSFNLPTEKQCRIISTPNDKRDLNHALRTFDGTIMDKWYWSKTAHDETHAWYIDFHSYANTGFYDKKATSRVRAFLAAPNAMSPSGTHTNFSTIPVHLALCATATDDRTVYITADQWQSLSTAEQSRYEKKGVCLSANGETFLVALNDVDDGRLVEWRRAKKFKLPTIEQAEILANNIEELNGVITVFGGGIMNRRYWTQTQRTNDTVWVLYPLSHTIDYIYTINSTSVREVLPVPNSLTK